jgi:citrate synthase
MSKPTPNELLDKAVAWWTTGIIDIQPGKITVRGEPIEKLMGAVSFVEMIWLMLRGARATPAQARLLEMALVASVDHGPHAPSIAIARMSATCGVELNSAMASAIGILGDVHGGAGQQCVELLDEICAARGADGDLAVAAAEVVGRWRARSAYLPGFGHRFHPVDPRRAPLLALVDDAVRDGVVAGNHVAAARAVEELLGARVPMNIDGATAIIYAELGFPPPMARGLFVLSRSVGILAHAWEETQQGRRIKGPIPPSIRPAYLGPATPGHGLR